MYLFLIFPQKAVSKVPLECLSKNIDDFSKKNKGIILAQ